jgi:hypothetical protein
MIKSSLFRSSFHTVLVFVCRTFGMWGFGLAVWAAQKDIFLALGLCALAAALFMIADWFR